MALRVVATVAAYLLAFSVVGVPAMNYYWGGLYAPLLAFGVAWAAPSLRDLIESAFRQRPVGSEEARLRVA